jgi:hypothetical protein
MEIIIEQKKELGFEAVEIIDTKILRKTNEEIDLQLRGNQKRRGSLYWMLKS